MMEKEFYGLKGRCNIAQGNALGTDATRIINALKGQGKKAVLFMLPFQGED
jgi:hypothetical protein